MADKSPGDVLTAADWNDHALHPVAIARRASTDVTVTSTTWANFDTALDLTLDANAGDFVEVAVSGMWENQASDACLDVVSLVSGSPVNSWGSNGTPDNANTGVLAWFGSTGVFSPVGGSITRAVISGDLSGGTLTLRLRTRLLAAGSKDMQAISTAPFIVMAKNLRQP